MKLLNDYPLLVIDIIVSTTRVSWVISWFPLAAISLTIWHSFCLISCTVPLLNLNKIWFVEQRSKPQGAGGLGTSLVPQLYRFLTMILLWLLIYFCSPHWLFIIRCATLSILANVVWKQTSKLELKSNLSKILPVIQLYQTKLELAFLKFDFKYKKEM